VRLFKKITCDALFATKVQRKLSNSIAGFAAGGSSLDRQKSRQFALHLSDADHDQRMRKEAPPHWAGTLVVRSTHTAHSGVRIGAYVSACARREVPFAH
jgi:hypothetical protein